MIIAKNVIARNIPIFLFSVVISNFFQKKKKKKNRSKHHERLDQNRRNQILSIFRMQKQISLRINSKLLKRVYRISKLVDLSYLIIKNSFYPRADYQKEISFKKGTIVSHSILWKVCTRHSRKIELCEYQRADAFHEVH